MLNQSPQNDTSERRLLADRIATVITSKRLTSPHGGDVTRRKDSKSRDIYEVAFAQPRNLDGTVAIYSDHFLLVRYQTRYKNLPPKGNIVFKSEAALVEFLDSIPS